MTSYRIEAASAAAVISKIEAADPGFVVTGENGVKRVRQSCVTNPAQVMVVVLQATDSEGDTYTPTIPADPEIWFSVIEAAENAALAHVAS